MTRRFPLLALALLAAVTAVASALAAQPTSSVSVTSTLDGKKVLPIRIRWIAHPRIPASQVAEVDFLIDGKVRWIEHTPPYVYGGDDNGHDEGFLFTSWLTPGEHHFTARVTAANGTRTPDTVTARVLPPPAPPAALAGAWTRTVTAQDAGKAQPQYGGTPPVGSWKLIFDRVGAWELDPTGSGLANEYDAESGVLHVYAPIQMAPFDNGQGGVSRFGHHKIGGTDCTAAGPFGTYRWTVTGTTLTLAPLHEGCPDREAVWEGVWTRTTAAPSVAQHGVRTLASLPTLPGTITEFPDAGSNNAQVRAGVDGNLWFTDRAGKIGRITTSGAITEFNAGLNPGSQPFSIASGPDGNLWFTDAGATSAIGMVDPRTHLIQEFSAGLNPGGKPAGIVLGTDGKLWFTDNSASTPAIGSIDPATHVIIEYSVGLNPGSVPQQGIVAGPDGNIWFTDKGTKRAIGMIDPTTHAISEFALSPGTGLGAGLAVGPDGNLWFADSGAIGAIGTFDPTTHAVSEFPTGAGSVPGRVTVGPDGNVWFTDKGASPAIATIDPTTHVITRFSSGLNAGSAPGGIGTGPDGNIWFTDQGTIKAMGQLTTSAPTASVTVPSVTGTGGVNVAQTCGGDSWSSWAGQQPSRSAFGFDGYQWLLDGTPIAGATGTSYTPTAAQAGHELSCDVTATYTLLAVTVSATSARVEVESAAEQLSELAAAVVGVGPGASLVDKVAAIQSDLATDDTQNACADLVAFENEVDAQTGKKLGTTQAAALLDRVQSIQAALDC